MRNYYKKYKTWKLKKIHKWAQWYADLIIRRLEESTTEWEFNFWLMKGYDHNLHMIYTYDIYLD
jgi:hypothetical protein